MRRPLLNWFFFLFRIDDGVIFKTIYHRDGLYGFTEPLGFEDLNSVLDAYNSSEVDLGKLISTLVAYLFLDKTQNMSELL